MGYFRFKSASIMYYYRLISSMLKATVSTLLTGLYAVYKGEPNALASLTTNLYAVYKGESNANDSLGLYGGLALGGLTYASGISGNQFVFNGSNSSVILTTDAFKFTNDFSFSFWFTPTSISSNYCIFINDSYIAPNERGYRILQRDSRLELKIFNDTTTVTLITGSVFSANTRYFCTVTHSSTGNEIKINGVSQATDSNSTNAIFGFPSNPTQPYIGVNKGVGISESLFLNGKIDELYVWDRKITATEVTDLYNAGTGEFYQGSGFYSTIVNDSLGNYNGTTQGGLTYSTGKSGNAITFNGTDAYVDLGNNIFNSFTSDFSISVWVNLNSVSGNQCILNNLSYNASGFSNGWIFLMRNQVPYFEIYTDSGVYQPIGSPTILSTSTWYNIVVTRKSSTRSRIYVNGSLVVADTSSLNPTYVTTLIPIPSTIGTWRYNASTKIWYLNGKIDEVNTWNKELTATEVTDLYNAGTGKFYPY